MREYTQTLTTQGVGDWIRLDTRGNSIHIYNVLIHMTNEGGAEASVEFSLQRDIEESFPVCHNVLNRVTESTCSTIKAPISAIRLKIDKFNSGTVTLTVLQS